MIGPFSVRRARGFARAIDPGPRALQQDDQPRDEETRRLVDVTDRLRTGDFNGTPSPEFRERLRAQLVALAETQLQAPPNPSTPTGRARSGSRGHTRTRASRPSPRLTVLAGALSALVACSGLTVVVSGHALPGDTLYSLKRTTETVELALAHGEQGKAQRRLDFAQARARELADLVRRGLTNTAATQGPGGSEPFATTIGDMDGQTREGVRALAEFAVNTVSDPALADLASWTADQRAILEPVVERLRGDAGIRVRRSAALLDRIRDRVAALRVELTCSCMDRTHGDDLGPLPCWPCNPRSTPGPQAGTAPVPQTGGPRQGPSSQVTPATSAPPASPSGSAPPGGSTPGGGGLPQLTDTPPPSDDPSLLPPVTGEPTGGGLLPPILPTGVLPPILPGLLPGLLGG